MDWKTFLSAAKGLFPDDLFLIDAEDCLRYGSDWTKTAGTAGLVVRPRTTDEVSEVLKLCSQMKIPVVPSGGRTGLAGGAVARGELVLSFERMNRLSEVDIHGNTVRVQAGATTQAVHEHCAPQGLMWPIDLASKGSCEIGGNLSTNAGGLRVIRYGMARKWVVGLQAVTMAGEILELNRDLEKNNTGYDLIQLLIGSEGTLAVITEATLKLTRFPNHSWVMFFPFESPRATLDFFAEARRGPFEILAFEFFSKACLDIVSARLNRQSRLGHSSPFYALMEVEFPVGREDEVDQWLGMMLENRVVSDGLLAKSESEKDQVWGLREGITESIQATAPVKKYDVSVPVRKLAAFLEEVERALKQSGLGIELYLFGHLGDGSPHLNLVKPAISTMEQFNQDCAEFEKTIFVLLKSYGGSVSAEHGVGILKKHWLTVSRSPAEMRLFRDIKRVFDPQGLLNPGKVIDL
ncbi:MAG: FAD-binding oxidoreductase [Deltaproteobacteria bacterium]|nr:FAD-binding oxidoreductase [Deltaproteobacteria bacterium]MBI3294139.1 FAD-binding oxidoreductase [Deltaproteobacteria bacterium]